MPNSRSVAETVNPIRTSVMFSVVLRSESGTSLTAWSSDARTAPAPATPSLG